MIPVGCLTGLSTLLFFIGVFGPITRRNLLTMLISIELVLDSADINFTVSNHILLPEQLEGFFFTLFSIGISIAETVMAIAVVIDVYRNLDSDQVDSIENMKL